MSPAIAPPAPAPLPRRRREYLWRAPLGLGVALSFYALTEPSPADLALGSAIGVALVTDLRRIADIARPRLAAAFALSCLLPVVWAADPARAFGFGLISVYLMAVGLLIGVADDTDLIGGSLAFASLMNSIFLLAGAYWLLVRNEPLLLPFAEERVLESVGRYAAQSAVIVRQAAYFKDPNVAGAFSVVGLVYFGVRTTRGHGRLPRRGIARAACLLAAAACLGGIFATLSRGAVISAGCALVWLMVRPGGTTTWQTMLTRAMLVTGALLIGALAIGAATGEQRFTQLRTDYDQERFANWLTGLSVSGAHPLGIGGGMYEQLSRAFGNSSGLSVHSTYIRTLAENGVLGLAAVGALIAAVLRASRRRAAPLERLWPSAALAGIVAEAAIIDVLHWRHFWILLGLTVASLSDLSRPLTPDDHP